MHSDGRCEATEVGSCFRGCIGVSSVILSSMCFPSLKAWKWHTSYPCNHYTFSGVKSDGKTHSKAGGGGGKAISHVCES